MVIKVVFESIADSMWLLTGLDMSKPEKMVAPILGIGDDKAREAYLKARGYSPEVRKWLNDRTQATRLTVHSTSTRENERVQEMRGQLTENVMSLRLRSAFWQAASSWQAKYGVWNTVYELSLASHYLGMVDLLSPLSFRSEAFHLLTANYWTKVLRYGYLFQPPEDYEPAQLSDWSEDFHWRKPDDVVRFANARGSQWTMPASNANFSVGRVRESVIPKPFKKSLSKPVLTVQDGTLTFSLPKEVEFADYSRRAVEKPLLERHEVDVTSVTPLGWRFLLSKKALEIFEGLEDGAWFTPEGNPADWGEFLIQTFNDGFETFVPTKLFAKTSETSAFRDLRNLTLQELQLGAHVGALKKQRELEFSSSILDSK
jgi:hypothetical protein